MPSFALAEKDANAPVVTEQQLQQEQTANGAKGDIKSMEYHRQMLQSKMADEKYAPRQHKEDSPAAAHHGQLRQSLQSRRLRPQLQSQSESQLQSQARPDENSNLTGGDASQNNRSQKYISPSDNIMSPCTAKLTALRNKQIGKVKPKSLFAQTSSKKLESGAGGLFGTKSAVPPRDTQS